MADTYNKKAMAQKRAKRKQDKQKRREDRKANNDKGKSLDEMIVYLDEYGNFTDVPPEQQKRHKIKLEDIQLGAAPIIEQTEFEGIISLFFEDKGYGFIKEADTGETVFVHSNKLQEPVAEKDHVVYEKEKTPKGYAAFNVRKAK